MHEFWYDTQKKSKRYARDNGLEGWNEVAVWRECKPPIISRDIWTQYIEHMTSEQFAKRSQSGDPTHRRLRSVQCTCETDGKINLNEIYR